MPGLVERLLGIDAELACLDREAVSGRRQALVALCRGCLGWCVQDEAAVSSAGGDDLVAFQLTEDAGDGGGGHAKVAGELADGWQAGALGKDAGGDHGGDLAAELFVGRDRRVRVELEDHAGPRSGARRDWIGGCGVGPVPRRIGHHRGLVRSFQQPIARP